MSIQIEIKKKVTKPKKQTIKMIQIPQNNKKNIKLFNSNLDHGHKNDNNSNLNNNSIINNNNKTIHKLQEELNNFKIKSKKQEEEIIQLNLKIKEMTEKYEKNKNKNEEEKNSEDIESISSQKLNKLKQALSSIYSILIEIIELILNQKYRDTTLTARQMENISMDVYEQTVYTNEEKKSLLLEQIQQILIRRHD